MLRGRIVERGVFAALLGFFIVEPLFVVELDGIVEPLSVVELDGVVGLVVGCAFTDIGTVTKPKPRMANPVKKSFFIRSPYK